MLADAVDLDRYLTRIGYDGPRRPDLATLTAVHERHAQMIPFENIDVVWGRPVALDLPSLERKLVGDRRGGYCFEHNTLFAAVLQALGFTVTPMLARVRWQVPAGVVLPQTHMALRVSAEGRDWLADAGFGSAGLMEPIDLGSTAEQHFRYEPRRLVAQGHRLLQQVKLGDTWTDAYVMNPDEAYPADFEVANWYTSTHPQSRFRLNLMVARADGSRRYSILNREFTIRQRDGSATKRQLASPDELRDVLADRFSLVFPRGTTFTCPGLRWD